MKILLVVLGISALLAGAGGFAILNAGQSAEESAEAAPAPSRSAPPVFVTVEPLGVPVREGQRVRYWYFVQLSLQLADDSSKELVARHMPRIRDAFLRDLNGPPVTRDDQPDILDYEALKLRMMRQAEHVLGAGVVQDVLLVRAVRSG